MPQNLRSITHVYGALVRRPYFVVVHSQPRLGHERFDQYNPAGLTELMLSVVEHLTAGSPEYLECMCELDAADKARIPGRTRRYVSKRLEDLYAESSRRLLPDSVEYEGYWFSTNAKHTQTRQVIELACRACKVPYSPARKLKGLAGDA